MLALLAAQLALQIGTVSAGWQAVYTSNLTQAYVQGSNGSLYSLPITSQGESAQNVYDDLKLIASAPTNSSLVLDSDGHLFAVWGSEGCGSSPIEISQYNPHADQWSSLAQSGREQHWYQDLQIVWLDRSTDTIYIYGGDCNGKTQSGFYSYSLNNNTFNAVNAHGGAMPRDMSAAQVIPLDDYQTLIIGGRSNDAWMSMQQVAIWGHGSWEFSSVSNSSGIDSRDDPLVLPIWQKGAASPISQVLVVGGSVVGRTAKPDLALLVYNATTGWYWSNTFTSSDNKLDLSYAGFALYETFAAISSDSETLLLYDSSQRNTYQPVSALTVPKSTSTSNSGKKTSTAVVAVISTILPIIALCLLGAVAWWWWRRRQERRLMLLPNRRSMLRMHDRAESNDTRASWNVPPPPLHTRGPVNDSGSVVMMDISNDSQIYMSRQRRNLRVVNPDAEAAEAAESMRARSTSASQRPSPIGSRETSWSSGSTVDPFQDKPEQRSEFDFGL